MKKKQKKEKYTTLEEWLGLGKEISKVWDKNISVDDEMKYQRNKE